VVSPVTDSRATRQALAAAFAELLSYPFTSVNGRAREHAEMLAPDDPEARGLLVAFADVVETTPLGTLQEAYTRTFDLDTMTRSEPTCYPYVGHYLFEENHSRGAFILGLRTRYRANGFEDDGEVADHLLVLLRFLSVCADDTLAEELIADAILPALARMAVAAQGDADAAGLHRDAYLGVLRALEVLMRRGREAAVIDRFEQEIEREWLRDRDSLGISRDWCGH
jgi:nitrate reductase assembly molybdenum cofactor insertion protein NarJ